LSAGEKGKRGIFMTSGFNGKEERNGDGRPAVEPAPAALDFGISRPDTARAPIGSVDQVRAHGGPLADDRDNRLPPPGNDYQLSFFPEEQSASPDEQRVNLMALSQIKGMGEVSVKALFDDFPDLDAVWDANPLKLRNILVSAGSKNWSALVEEISHNRRMLQHLARRSLEELEERDVRLLVHSDAEYPKQLREIADPPRWLFVEGDPGRLAMPNLVAVVGTRKPTREGVALARALTGWLAKKGFGIVSGLADGIDQAAHRTAIDHGTPTIGVMGTGILTNFPAASGPLRKRIVEDGGAVVTEYFPRDTYSRDRFVRRNRIQAGLSYATVPVEAQAKSGTAHTYRFARDYGRVTFGVERSSVPMENGILGLIRSDGNPVFDLDSQESTRALEELLAPALSDVPAEQRKARLFGALMREFGRVVAAYPVTADDLEDLKTRMDEEWERAKRDGTSGDTRP
jgi:DNA processing protein